MITLDYYENIIKTQLSNRSVDIKAYACKEALVLRQRVYEDLLFHYPSGEKGTEHSHSFLMPLHG